MGNPSEFNYGGGLSAPPAAGHELSPYERLRATRLTDTTNPEANEDDVFVAGATQSHSDPVTGVYVPGTLRPGVTPPVKETNIRPSTGQHAPIDPSTYSPDHDPEGMQDGEGQAWRDTYPPNPVS